MPTTRSSGGRPDAALIAWLIGSARSASAASTPRRCAPRRPPRRSPPNGCGSPGSCTTWSRTASASSPSRPASAAGSSTPSRPRPARRSTRSRRPAGRPWPGCAGCSARCASRTGHGGRSGRWNPRRAWPTSTGWPRRRPRPGVRVDVRWHGRAAAAAARDRPVRVPDRPGGGHQRGPPRRHRRLPGDHRLPGDEELSVEVARRRAAARTGSAGTGYGLVGMRERVGLLHGDFTAGPRPDGGFRVAARLPRAGGGADDGPGGARRRPAAGPGRPAGGHRRHPRPRGRRRGRDRRRGRPAGPRTSSPTSW